MKRALSIAVLLGACTLLGCASTHRPLSSENQALMGESVTVCIPPQKASPAITTPEFRYRTGPDVENRMAGVSSQIPEGIKEGLSWGKIWLFGGCYGQGCLGALALALATSTTGALIGGVAGGLSGFLSGKPELSPELETAILEAKLQEILADRVHSRLKVGESLTISRCAVSLEGKQPDIVWALRKAHVDALLLLGISRLDFVGTSNTGPHRLRIRVTSNLLSAKDLGRIDSRAWRYFSEAHTLAEWQANNAKLLVQELERFCEAIAEKVKNELFTNSPKDQADNLSTEDVASPPAA